MLQVARLAPRMLGEAAQNVIDFLRSQQNPDGSFKDRAGKGDLYYTVFGVEALAAMRAEVDPRPLTEYLRGFDQVASLDFVHLACLARGWANVPPDSLDDVTRASLIARIESHRSVDGGYDATPGAAVGTLYGCFLALGAYQDLGIDLPNPQGVLNCITSLRADDGGYANGPDFPHGLTPSTSAAAALLRQLDHPAPPELGQWLLTRCRPEGGFFATPQAPIPDLLSTATALHALAGLHVDFSALKEPCLDFVDTLWSSQGGFYGTWEEDVLDCEYTYYGLLALGHLSL
jgi:prenyltransferase beta subunit